MSIKQALSDATRNADHVGRLIAGLAVLRETCAEVLLIAEDFICETVPTDRLGVSFNSITIHDRPLVPFDGLGGWELDSGEPCVAFETHGKLALFAPAKALDAADMAKTVARFVARWDPSCDHVYLSALDGGIAYQGQDNLSLDDGVLSVNGETLPLTGMTWAQDDEDGDGNTHLHVVMADGRYRRLAIGDLGR